MNEEAEYAKTLAEAGVDLPELETQTPEEKTEEAPAKVEAEDEPKDEPLEPKSTERIKRNPDIYDEYKAKKRALKDERELRETAERERDELKEKLEAVATATTPQEKREAQDELEQFATETGTDLESLKRMRALFLKDLQPQIDPQLSKDLQEFKEWKTQNSQVLEKQMFEQEFSKVTPSLKEMFPSVSNEELNAIKTKLDEVAHSKEYHDKDLDYVAFKNRDLLSTLVSPKKRGLESRGRKEAQGEESYDFDPNADLSTLTATQMAQWQKEYDKAVSNTGLTRDSEGRLMM